MASEMLWAVSLSSNCSIMARENGIAVPAPLEVIMCLLITVDSEISDGNSLSTDGWQVIGNVSLSP